MAITWAWAAALFAGLFPATLLAQSASPAQPLSGLNSYLGLKVSSIQFINLSAADQNGDTLRDLVPVKVGHPLMRSEVRESLQLLYSQGRFAAIEVEAEITPLNQVSLKFVTQPKFFVGHLSATGVGRPPTETQLLNATKLQLGDSFSSDEIPAAIERIQHVLQENGYFQAQVTPSYEFNRSTQQVNIAFSIKPGLIARVGKIVVNGQPGFGTEEIENIARIHPGDRVSNSQVTRALQYLRKKYQKKNHLEAQVSVTDRNYNRVSNTLDYAFAIERGPVVEVAVEGANLRSSVIKRYVPIYEENAVDEDLLNEGSRNLREYFQTQGYFDTHVDVTRRTDSSDRHTTVIYDVNRGERHKLTDLVIKGNKYFDQDTIRERMRVVPAAVFFSAHGRFSQSMLNRDVQSIESLYRANGFQKVSVTPEVQDDYLGQKGRMRVTINIAEGPQSRVQTLALVGNKTFQDADLRDLLSNTEGQPYSDFNINSDRDTLQNYYFNRGFPNVTVQPFADALPNNPTRVNVRFEISEGEQRFVNNIFLTGLNHTHRYVVDRELQVKHGQPLSQIDMLDTQRNLYDLGIFNAVDVAVQDPQGSSRQKNVLVQLDEARRYTLSYGLGMEVQTGGAPASCQTASNQQASSPVQTCLPQGRTGVSPRVSFDVTRINFLGRDYTVLFKSRYGRLQQRALLSIEAPRWLNRQDFKLTFSGFFDKTQDVFTFTAQRLEGSVQLQQTLSRASTLLYRFTYRRVSVDPATLQVDPNLIPLLSKPVRVSLPDATYVRDTRDNPIDSKQGQYNTFDLGVAASVFGSQSNFTRLLFQNSTYHPFKKKQWVLARSTRIGIEEPFGSPDFSFVPLPERYFAGGGNSHRGFSINQAGPRDLQTGFPLGGSALFLNNIELRTPPLELPFFEQNLSAVFFHDAGNVFASAGDIFPSILRVSQKNADSCRNLNPNASCDFNYLAHAVGAGLRYRTPIGPVRVDLGYNLNPTVYAIRTPAAQAQVQTLRRFNFFFSIGQTF